MRKKNAYVEPTAEDILKKENEKKEIQARIETVSKLASECLDDPKFKLYRETYEAMRDEIFAMIERPGAFDPDPIKDAYYLRSCINSIVFLGKLLKMPKEDIKKG